MSETKIETKCHRCHGTGWRRHAFYTDGRPCSCGWEPGGALRLAAEAAYAAELADRQTARAARRAARKAVA